jgi:hypothetical protein
MNRIELTQSINRWICRAAPLLAIGAVVIVALSGCGEGDGGSTPTDEFQIEVPTTPTTTAQSTTAADEKEDSPQQNPYGGGGSGKEGVKPVGAPPACTPATINAGVKAWAKSKSKSTKASLINPNYKCADGWAIALVNVGSGANTYTSTLVFVGIDVKWVAQNRQEVCKSPSPVPNRLYQLGCNSN